jgi:hypothetical protein
MTARCIHFFRLLLLNWAVAQIFRLAIGGFARTDTAGIPQKEYLHVSERPLRTKLLTLFEHSGIYLQEA